VTAAGGAPPAAAGDAPAPTPGSLERRARRLLRWYPGSWRARYGEEFAELLLAELAEQPRAWRRTVNVAHCGLTARLAAAGLAGPPAGTAGARASLGTLTCSLAVFLTFGTAMWAQLAVGWQWAPPATTATAVAMLVMSGSLLFLAVLALLAAVPVGWVTIMAGFRRQARGLRAPALLTGAASLVLVVGGRHFGNGWPGTGGHWWPHQGLAPGGIAAFGWASTLSVTSYWAHPAALASFPPAELAWMVASPVALLSLATGAAQLVRRLELSPRVLAFETRIGRAAAAGMTVFLAGALCWVTQAGPGPHGLFRTGDIDAAGLAALAAALATGWLAISRARPIPPARAAGQQ
jgi:hypothetical protein